MRVWFQGQNDPLTKEMATHSYILAWEIPWTEEPGGLHSMGSQKELDVPQWLDHIYTFKGTRLLWITYSLEVWVAQFSPKPYFLSSFSNLFVSNFVAGRGTPNRPQRGLLSNTRKWVVRGGTHADEAREFTGKGVPRRRAGGQGNPGGLLCHVAPSLGFNGDDFSFQLFTGQSFWLRVLPGSACIAQPRCMPARILGGMIDTWHLLWTFPRLFWLV